MLLESKLPEGVSKNKAHSMTLDAYLDYYDDLALAAGAKPRPWWFVPAIELIRVQVRIDIVHFRDERLYIYEDGRVDFR